jgi:hypothetical protein
MTRARGVVESLPFSQMRPSNSLLTGGKGYVFAQAGEAYLVYLPDGGSLNLNLSASSNSYSAQWFNPRDGSTKNIGSVAGGGVRSFSASDGNDWALVLRRSGAGSNVAPTVSSQAAETPVGTPRDLTLVYADPDGPGPYTITIDQPPSHGTLSGSGTARRYTPAAGYNGTDSFRWHVNDGKANSAVVTFSLSVKAPGANVPPVAQDRNVTSAGGSTTYIQLAYTDPDGPGPSTITIVQPPAHGTLTGTDNDRYYTSSPGFAGADSFTWKVNDGLTVSNVARVSIQVTATDSGGCKGQPVGAVPCFVEQNGVVSMEAENYTAQSGYSVLTPGGASGGKAMQVGSSGHLDFEVSFAQAGRWYFWIRSQAHDSEMNGIYLEVDGVRQAAPADHPKAGGSDIYLKKGTNWFWTPEWKQGKDGEHQGPVTIDLARAGTHKISIVKRGSEEPWLDKIVLTRSSTPPSGTGPGETTGVPAPDGPNNTPPRVDAGSNQAVTLPAEASLRGTVTDDGMPKPPSQVATSWSKVSGAGTVNFSKSSGVDTTASFSQSGIYVLRLTANDGKLSSSDDLTVTVNPAPEAPAPGEVLVVSGLAVSSGKAYEVVKGGLKSGARVYIDRSYTFTSVPGSLLDAAYVRTANDDKEATQEKFLSFTVSQDVTVYVAYDSRASDLPGWLSGWTDVGQILNNSDVALDLYSKDFVAGPISLGGNLASGARGAASNYTLVIVGNGTSAGGPVVVSGLTVSSNKGYRVVPDLSVGGRVYIDRQYTYTNVPAVIDGAVHVNTANDDKAQSGTSFLTFAVDRKVTVYLAYDSRATSLPAWLAGWSKTGGTLNNTDTLLKLYARDFAAGTIVLGGNLAAGAAGALSNYSVAVVPG